MIISFKILGMLTALYAFVPSALMAVELRLTENGNFREVFDSGLRPTMLGGKSNRSCYVENISISLNIEGHVFPEVIAKRVDIDVLENHLMDEVVVFASEKITVEEARDLAIRWGVAENELVDTNLENFGWKLIPKNNKWRANAAFASSYNKEKPLLFRLFISWKRPFSELETHQGLLPPPPGYEDVSMGEAITDALKESNSNVLPDKDVAPNSLNKNLHTNSLKLTNASPKRSVPFPWWLVAGAVILLTAALVAWLKIQKSKSNHTFPGK